MTRGNKLSSDRDFPALSSEKGPGPHIYLHPIITKVDNDRSPMGLVLLADCVIINYQVPMGFCRVLHHYVTRSLSDSHTVTPGAASFNDFDMNHSSRSIFLQNGLLLHHRRVGCQFFVYGFT